MLPTRGAGTYSGGLNVENFLKRLSFQQVLDPVAAQELGEVTARISRLEGMEAHARQADARLLKYLGQEGFEELDLSASGAGAKNTDQSGKISNAAAIAAAAAAGELAPAPPRQRPKL